MDAPAAARVARLSGHLCIGEMENREVVTKKNRVVRTPIKIAFSDPSAKAERYAGNGDVVILEGELLTSDAFASSSSSSSSSLSSDTVLVFMHPSGIQNLLPMPVALAKAGTPVITCTTRYPNNDSCLIMEKCLIDMGAVIDYAKKRLGFAKVVLCGWSGGGSLSTFYQAQATRPTVTHTPAGDALDLSKANLPKADALLCLAAHTSRARIFTEWLDPAVLDETNPDVRDAALDLWGDHPDCQPPFTEAFKRKFRDAQIARNRRITAWCVARLEALAAGRPKHAVSRSDVMFVVNCTQADLRRLDDTIDPNGRPSTTLETLSLENHAPVGLARFTTCRSWLSQWSYDLSNADGPRSMASVDVPVLVLSNSADHLVPTSHPIAAFEAIPHDDKEFVSIEGASHYYFNEPENKAKGVAAIQTFLEKRGFRVRPAA